MLDDDRSAPGSTFFHLSERTGVNTGTLVVMAAGQGTRYGGLKQLDPVGPSGETLLEYSIFDALRAGFSHVVVVLRRDIEAAFRSTVGSRLDHRVPVTYAFQDEDPLRNLGARTRHKPWGTGHALLVAVATASGPFAVVNADDYYGPGSFEVLAGTFGSPEFEAALVGFRLRDTLSNFGPVKRGLCVISASGKLEGVLEVENVSAAESGPVQGDIDGKTECLSGAEIVSMNMWGFQQSVIPRLHAEWSRFLSDHGDSESAEFHISTAVTSLIRDGMACQVLESRGDWFGVTYREDRPMVVQRIEKLIAENKYRRNLWA